IYPAPSLRKAPASLPSPPPVGAHVGVYEEVVLFVVAAEPPVPPQALDGLHHLGYAHAFDPEVHRLAQGVLAVRGHVAPLLAHHLVALGAAVARDDVDASPGPVV